jgi:putative ABC transport system substrate-binding protein
VRRRAALAGLGAAFALREPGRPAWAQAGPKAAPKVLRVGIASMLNPAERTYTGLVGRMAELGYVEGRNFVFDFVRVSSPAEYAAGYGELVKRGAHILFAGGSEGPLQAARTAANDKVPIVFLAIDYDPFKHGYVASLARPGANITGVFVRQVELAEKRIEMARDALPGLHRLALWWDYASREQFEAAATTAKAQGLEIHPLQVDTQLHDYKAAFAASEAVQAQAVVMPTSPAFFNARAEIGRLAQERRLPVVAAIREYVEAGALLSYGIELVSAFRDTASYIDRIARGASPADLPVEQPTKFELVVSLKTARAIGLGLSPAILTRADEVIE